MESFRFFFLLFLVNIEFYFLCSRNYKVGQMVSEMILTFTSKLYGPFYSTKGETRAEREGRLSVEGERSELWKFLDTSFS